MKRYSWIGAVILTLGLVQGANAKDPVRPANARKPVAQKPAPESAAQAKARAKAKARATQRAKAAAKGQQVRVTKPAPGARPTRKLAHRKPHKPTAAKPEAGKPAPKKHQ